jgi:signal transduction protein with GAF and PtsI domain
MTEKKIQVEFAPGCFDDFDGTQQELDDLVAEIERLANSGEMFENSMPVTEESLADLSEEEQRVLLDAVRMFGADTDIRNLQ